ncbi:MAG: TonB-dependent siderophore receptor, partial [Cyanobacteria bacterium P01_H01_bin.119]
TVIIDLINTQLDLATDDSILQDNPVAGIASVQIAPLDGNSVRITVVGQEQAPAVEVNQADGELIVGVATGEAIANQPAAPPTEEEPLPSADSAEEEEDAIRLIVTGEAAESPYLAPETTGINRTDTSLFEIPQTIQVLPERLLEDQQVIRLQDALLNVPNAVQGNQFGGASEAPIVRGFDQLTILRDGFRRSTVINARQAFQEIANVERIEVLSGPASILYGSIEPGGVVNLVTKRPLSEFFAEAELQVGSFGLIRPTVDITGPVTAAGDLLYRLNVAYERSDGFRNFDTDVERLFIAPTLEWRPSDRTTVTFDLEYLSDRRPFDRGIFPFDDGVVDVPRNTIFGEPGDFAEFETLDIGYRLEHQFSDNWQLRNRFRYSNTDFFNLRAEVNEALGGINQAAGIVVRGFASNDGEVKTFDFQTELIGEFTTGSIDHTVLLGFDILFSSLSQVTTGDLAPVVSLFDPVVGLIDQPNTPLPFTLTDTESDLLQFGIILQDQIQVLPNLTFLLGGRFDFINQRTQAAPIFIPGLAFSPGSEEDQSFTNFSPRLGVVYQPVEPLSLYASYSRSFTPNTLEQTTASGDFLDPQEAEQFEIGVKAELLGGRLAATLALFDLTLRNVAVTDPNNPNAVLPIGQQNSQGLELTVQGEILPGWNIAASYGLLNANIPESPNFPNGATPAHVPENTASLFTTYEIQSGDLAGLGFGLGVFFVDQRFGNFENDFRLDSYWRTDASIFYRSDRWRAGLSFQNIFDEEFFTGGVLRRGTNPGQPFTVVGSISITF